MSGERIARAKARIESAIGRIETAAPRAAVSDPALSEKYEALRSEAGRALAEIDQLIETLSQ